MGTNYVVFRFVGYQLKAVGFTIEGQCAVVMALIVVVKTGEKCKIGSSEFDSMSGSFITVVDDSIQIELMKLMNGPPISVVLDGVQSYFMVKAPCQAA